MLQRPETITFMIEDARLLFRNFEGREARYNKEGDRNFNVVIEPELAQRMIADGWNVRKLRDRELDGEILEGEWVIEVAVGFERRPPTVVMIGSKARTRMTEDTVGLLDWVDIAKCDLIARSYHWSNPAGGSGIKAYLQSLYMTINEDYLEQKYALDPAEE